jgi:AraC-like DNA-binding protein
VPPRSYFPRHEHAWGQLVYAISGVLNVAVDGHCFVIPPEQAVWLPSATPHSVGSLHGAEFRSLYVSDRPEAAQGGAATVLGVSPLVRELVIEAAALTERSELTSAYGVRVVDLIIDSLGRLETLPFSLPWPRKGPLSTLCEALYENPADARGQEAWARSLGMSGRTLARRCESELGMSLRAWRRGVRLFRAVELLGSGASITDTALALGYASTSAFIYMFRCGTGQSPRRYAGSARRA